MKLGRTIRTIQRWLAELVSAGLVIVKKRQRSSAEYELQNVVSNVVSKAEKCRVWAKPPCIREILSEEEDQPLPLTPESAEETQDREYDPEWARTFFRDVQLVGRKLAL